MTATTQRTTITQNNRAAYDVDSVRAQFPILQKQIDGRPLVYLDNAASSQKPQRVIQRLVDYYAGENSNVHRGVHTLSQQATDAYEGARERIRAYINAASVNEVVYTRGATEAINLVASTYGRVNVGEGDEILISGLEHHSNIVPWQLLCEEKGARVRIIPVDEKGEIDVDALPELINERTKLVAVAHISNALGTILPLKHIIELAHDRGVPVLIDGAQAVPHTRIDVQALDADFYCFSGHKMFGPTGIGILYGKEALLEAMPPYQGGGDMIETVSYDGTTFNTLPYKFEAGTPHIAGAVGLAEAVAFLDDIDIDLAAAYEHELLTYATERMRDVPGMRFIGTASEKASVISFLLGNAHPYDVGTLLDKQGIAVRTGHHCVQPLMDHYKIPGTVRASIALYNTREDIDRLVDGLLRVSPILLD